MNAVQFDRFGDPAEVLHVANVPQPTPGPGQVRVRMIASPINPSDLLTIRGLYGLKPALPAIPGFEGVGIVESNGGGLLGKLRLGKRVAVLNNKAGNWAEYVVVPSRQVVPVPDDVTDEQAASFFVNPATALVMTRWIFQVPRGAWVLQTAAGSALGRMVIRLGKMDGFRTLNIVRRREQAEELKREGADAVICTADESVEERVKQITNGAGVPFALDCVGGKTGSEAARALGMNGRMLVYGSLSLEPITVDPRGLIISGQRVEGFWLSLWVKEQGVLTMLKLFRQIKRLLKEGVLKTDVTASFPMEQIQAAAKRADEPGKGGKVLLKIAK